MFVLVGGVSSPRWMKLSTRKCLPALFVSAQGVALGSEQDALLLDTAFAHIDEYIFAGLSSRPRFPFTVARRSIHYHW